MRWDLEYNRIVNLKEQFGPRDLSPEAERTSKTYFRDSALRDPRDSVRKYGIRSIKINDSIAEAVSYTTA